MASHHTLPLKISNRSLGLATANPNTAKIPGEKWGEVRFHSLDELFLFKHTNKGSMKVNNVNKQVRLKLVDLKRCGKAGIVLKGFARDIQEQELLGILEGCGYPIDSISDSLMQNRSRKETTDSIKDNMEWLQEVEEPKSSKNDSKQKNSLKSTTNKSSTKRTTPAKDKQNEKEASRFDRMRKAMRMMNDQMRDKM